MRRGRERPGHGAASRRSHDLHPAGRRQRPRRLSPRPLPRQPHHPTVSHPRPGDRRLRPGPARRHRRGHPPPRPAPARRRGPGHRAPRAGGAERGPRLHRAAPRPRPAGARQARWPACTPLGPLSQPHADRRDAHAHGSGPRLGHGPPPRPRDLGRADLRASRRLGERAQAGILRAHGREDLLGAMHRPRRATCPYRHAPRASQELGDPHQDRTARARRRRRACGHRGHAAGPRRVSRPADHADRATTGDRPTAPDPRTHGGDRPPAVRR